MQYLGMDPRREYIKQGVMTASPAELLVMLFDACIKNLKLAEIAYDEKKDICATNNYLIKAQKIIGELISCLDMNIEISGDLLSIYDFMLRQLRKINARKDMSGLPQIIQILESMRNTWREVAKMQRESMMVNY